MSLCRREENEGQVAEALFCQWRGEGGGCVRGVGGCALWSMGIEVVDVEPCRTDSALNRNDVHM